MSIIKLVGILLCILTFVNCSPKNFVIDESSDSYSRSFLITNKKLTKITTSNNNFNAIKMYKYDNNFLIENRKIEIQNKDSVLIDYSFFKYKTNNYDIIETHYKKDKEIFVKKT